MKLVPLPQINSKFFNWKEFITSSTADKLNIDNNPRDEKIILNLKDLSNELSKVRQAFGKPILVNSGFRCSELNKSVGGHPYSLHQHGRAADLRCITDTLTYELYCFLDQWRKAPGSKIYKVILEKGKHYWVHTELF